MRQLTIVATTLWLAALMPRYHWIGLALGGLALCGIIGRWGRAGAALLDRLPLALVLLMLALTAWSLFVLLPQVDSLRLALPPGRATEALPPPPPAGRVAA